MKKYFFVFLLIILVIVAGCKKAELKKTECKESDRSQECKSVYYPTCGWFSETENFEFPNPCFACLNPDVLYWTEGSCPKK